MCNLVTIQKTACQKGRGGIAELWVLPASSVTGLTFDGSGTITGIEVDCLATTNAWVRIYFERDTGFFNQEKSRPNGRKTVNVVQTISFNIDLMNPTNRAALSLLNECCELHAVVKDNAGRYHYAGISTFTGGTWQSEELRTGDGSGNTGADSAADVNEYAETLVSTVNFYAPFLSAAPASISTDCTGVVAFGPADVASGNGDAYGPVGAASGNADAYGTANHS
jgi:hypothetical protein